MSDACDVVVEICSKVATNVIVCVAPVASQIVGILGKVIEVAGVIQVVTPSVSELAGETMPRVAAQRNLQGVVAGCRSGVDLIDDAQVGILSEVRARGLLR